ncbi:MAG: substrate-binding domain-containing protein [Hespellia sp.]|nr:substrate-binding domain-containing protein [Hespellia sp.]
MKKKFISAILSVMMVGSLLLTGCGGENSNETAGAGSTSAAAENKETFTIGFSDFSLTAEYQAKLRDEILDYAEKTYGDELEFVVLDGESDSDTQNSGIDNLISQKVDLIIMVPFDAEQQIPAVQAAVDAGIPLLEVCLQTADDGLRTSFVGSDDTSSGVLEMQCLAEAMGGKGNVVYLHGPTGQDSEIKRHEGANQVLEDYPDIEVAAESVCNWDRAEAMTAIENYVQSGMQIDAIFCENDEMALGAYAAIEGTDLEGKIHIGGIDCISDALQAVKDGKLDCTVLQDAKLQASEVVEAAYKVLHGEDVEEYIEVPYQLVTKDNADDEYFNN